MSFSEHIKRLVEISKSREQISKVLSDSSQEEAKKAALGGLAEQEQKIISIMEAHYVPREVFNLLYGKTEAELLTSSDDRVRQIAKAALEDREEEKNEDLQRNVAQRVKKNWNLVKRVSRIAKEEDEEDDEDLDLGWGTKKSQAYFRAMTEEEKDYRANASPDTF